MNPVKKSKRCKLKHKPYDERYPVVAERLRNEIASVTDVFDIEHVGSTSIPGSSGKGIIDLLALYPEGKLEQTKEILLSIGFCEQGEDFPFKWPEDRPMYLGIYNFGGDSFTIYIHVIRNDSKEVKRFLAFRESLRKNTDLLREYCEVKESLITEGVKDPDEYTKRKNPIIKKILEQRG
ncbi:MAG TPA: GrpB family protein [Nitrospirae bacterium]|nr:dephospho-CoA kinase/protein folding accessory domain-containing protein [bacterium BMS3Abin10]GBE39546.1 dephospho-CoA kinase/protein folding accessory domain-containing protein [bacterium BMS3Bbin08]HDK16511.1 GrpB family protein [Nitrospirota bacterium]HDK81935.1 GrpB family protein [Nitrospirota bacterium]HDO25548.1 GrpB family protein [Nitrospirota bacterium]